MAATAPASSATCTWITSNQFRPPAMGSIHPAHVRSELEGIPLLEKFAAIDVSDSDDPDLAEKIAALQARNFREHPEVATVAAQAASFTVPDGSGSPAKKGLN